MDKIKAPTSKHFKFFFSFFKPQWKLIILSAILIYVGVLFQLPVPLVTRYIIDSVLPGKEHQILNWILLGLFSVLIFQLLSTVWTSYLSALIKERVLNRYQLHLFSHILNLHVPFFQKNKSGYLLARIENDVSNLRGLVTENFLMFIRDVFTFITGVVIIFTFHWKLALSSIAILPFYLFSLHFFSRKIRSVAGEVQEQSAGMFGFIQEALAGIFVIKSFQVEDRESHKLAQKQYARMKVNLKYSIIASCSSNITSCIGALGPLLLLLYGGHEVINGNLSLGTMVAFNSFLTYLFGPARRFMNLNEQVQHALASLDRIAEILEVPSENAHTNGKEKIDRIAGRIEFYGVNFAYSENKPVLNDITFTANPGEITAIIGKSGAGKTTMMHLISRYFEPQAGSILLDGKSIYEYDLKNLRRWIGIVPQEVFLFSGTIKDNIGYGNLEATEEEIMEAAHLAHVDEFANRLPQKFDTVVGERGSTLSGGQRQRIALARVLLRNSKILVLDEPTSELDPLSEQFIQDTISVISHDHTIFIIAHRLDTVIHAHQILLLENGTLSSKGTHETLFETCDHYRALLKTQYADNIIMNIRNT